MRKIFLDTETTGTEISEGHRIVEIGCVELVNRQLTGNNPERDSEEGALKVHGLTAEFLSDKPKFAEIAKEFIEYVKGAEVLIHNAPFDKAFLDAELKRASFPEFSAHITGLTDTLAMARQLYPGKGNSLDALCNRLEISNAHRTLHGALLDAELLAKVYLAMTRGQNTLMIDVDDSEYMKELNPEERKALKNIRVIRATEEELSAHEAILDSLDKKIKKACLWRQVN